MRRLALVLFVLGVLTLPARADYLGVYDNGDSLTLMAVVNDNGTAADSVGGDSIAAYIYGNGAALDTVKMSAVGSGIPWVSSFFGGWSVDTTGAGYGGYFAILRATDVGAGTRDPVGLATWVVRPNAYRIAEWSADSVALQGLDNVPGIHLGNYQQDDSVEIYCRMVNVDSVYAYTYFQGAAIDTIKLVATAFGYHSTIEADTAGGGWGTWLAYLRGWRTGPDAWATVSWDMRDWHLYAQETAESSDVYIHDPDDSTVALVVRDTLIASAMMDTLDSATVRIGRLGVDSTYVYVAQWPDLADAVAESVWTGSTYTKALENTHYTIVAESVAAHVANLDTINYVAHVGSTTVVDSVINVYYLYSGDSIGKVATVDSTGLVTNADSLRIVRGITLPVDSVVGVFRLERADSVGKVATVDSAGKVTTVATVDSAGIATFVDSARIARGVTLPIDSVIGVFRLERGDSIGKVAVVDSAGIVDTVQVAGRVDVVDSATATARNWLTDSARVVATADSAGELGAIWGSLLSEIQDSIWTEEMVVLTDTFTAEGLLVHADTVTADSVKKTGWVGFLDSSRVLGKAWDVDSARVAGLVKQTDSVVVANHVNTGDSIRVISKAWDVDSLRKCRTTDSTGKVKYADTLKAAHRVATATFVDSARAVKTVSTVSYADSLKAVHRVWKADSLRIAWKVLTSDSTGKATTVTTVDSTGLLGQAIASVDSVKKVGVALLVDSTTKTATVDSAGLVTHVTLTDSTTGAFRLVRVDSAGQATYVDSARVAANLSTVDAATIAESVWTENISSYSTTTAGSVLVHAEARADDAADSLAQISKMTAIAVDGGRMSLTDTTYSILSDSVFYYTNLDETYPYPSVGNIIWNTQKESLATLATIAAATADSIMDTLLASAVLDSLDSLTTRLGRTGDSTLAKLAESIRDNLNAVTFDASDAALVADSILTQVLDTMWYADGTIGFDTASYDSGTVAAFLWDGGAGVHRLSTTQIDTTTTDTSGTKLGAYQTGGSAVEGTEVYVYTLADSGYSFPLFGTPSAQNSDGWYRIWVTAPKVAGDTIYYRVRFHAPGYVDAEKIVRFPQ